MALTSFRLSLKRQRPNIVDRDTRSTIAQQETKDSTDATVLKDDFCAGHGCQQSIFERTACCASNTADELYNPRTRYPLNSCYKRSRGRLPQNQTLSFHAMLIPFTIIFLSSLSPFRFVTGELQHRQLHRDENSSFQNRSKLNRTWEEGELQEDELSKSSWGGDTSLAYIKKKEHGGCTTDKGRELARGAFGRFFRQQKVNNNIEEKLPPVLRNNFSQPPSETNVSSPPSSTQPPVDEPITALLDYGDSIKKGNPLIQSILRISFQVELLVKDAITNELLKQLKLTLENYIQTEYQKLIDRGNIDFIIFFKTRRIIQ